MDRKLNIVPLPVVMMLNIMSVGLAVISVARKQDNNNMAPNFPGITHLAILSSLHPSHPDGIFLGKLSIHPTFEWGGLH